MSFWSRVILFLLLSSCALQLTPQQREAKDEVLGIDRSKNDTIILVGYIAGAIRRSMYGDRSYKRTARFISGALSYAINRINTMNHTELPPSISNNTVVTNRYPPLPLGYKVDMEYMETYGEMGQSIKNTAQLCEEGKVMAIIGPQETCRTEAAIAAAYNMPMISHFCDDHSISENHQTDFPTFIRTRPQAADVAVAVVSLLKSFNWTKIAYITTDDNEYKFMINKIREEMRVHGIKVLHSISYSHPYLHRLSRNTFMDIVENTYKTARIYVIVGESYEPVGLLKNLERRGLLDTGHYFVVAIDKRYYEDPYKYVTTSWAGDNSADHVKTNAYRAYIHITHHGPQPESANLLRLNNQYLDMAPFWFNISISGSQTSKNFPEIPEVGYIFDAIWLYATAIGRILRDGGSYKQIRNGTLVAEKLIGIEYKSSLGYLNRINEMGDSEGNFTVLMRRRGTRRSDNGSREYGLFPIGVFTPKAAQHGKGRQRLYDFQLNPNEKIDWIRGVKPVDEPVCGFNGRRCIVKPNNTVQILLGVLSGVLLVLLVGGVFMYRNRRFEQELERLLWKIDYREISFSQSPFDDMPSQMQTTKNNHHPALKLKSPRNLAGGGALANRGSGAVGVGDLHRTTSVLSCRTRPSFGAVGERKKSSKTAGTGNSYGRLAHQVNQCQTGSLMSFAMSISRRSLENDLVFMYTQVGYYKKQAVAVKLVHKASISLSRAVKKELKLLRDISHKNLTKFLGACVEPPEICAVWEYCARGSLQDILYDEKVSLNQMFIGSLVFDIVRGLTFLHHDCDIRFHGNLKSSNCVVDSRWVLKLTDFGLTEFSTGASVDHMDENTYYNSLVWTPPEILRYLYYRSASTSEGFLQYLNTDVGECTPVNKPDINAYQRADIYAFGVVLFELHNRSLPYSDCQHMAKEIIRRVIVLNDQFKVPYRPKLSLLSTIDKYITDCIKACWSEDPALRPSIKAISLRLKPVVSGRKVNIMDTMMDLMESYAKDLERLVASRTEMLMEEKKRTEELLYQMLPVPVAEQLKRGKQVEAEAFDSVSIYFSDICGFTELSAVSSPFEVVQLLNDLYTCFDTVISAYDVYKVETIGDAYMVVSGLPERNENHAGEIASMSLRLLHEVKTGFAVIPGQKDGLKLRIGLHSGPCCAGVVGTKMPRYCLFGDTVNTASRMESNGEPCRIHCSERCKLQLDKLAGYILQERGLISIKGKGQARTFWLLGKAKSSVVSAAGGNSINAASTPTDASYWPINDEQTGLTLSSSWRPDDNQKDSTTWGIDNNAKNMSISNSSEESCEHSKLLTPSVKCSTPGVTNGANCLEMVNLIS